MKTYFSKIASWGLFALILLINFIILVATLAMFIWYYTNDKNAVSFIIGVVIGVLIQIALIYRRS